jgi:hypothetical protein
MTPAFCCGWRRINLWHSIRTARTELPGSF